MSDTTLSCAVHAERAARGPCPRCGSFSCDACLPPGAPLCASCRQREQTSARAPPGWGFVAGWAGMSAVGLFAGALAGFLLGRAFHAIPGGDSGTSPELGLSRSALRGICLGLAQAQLLRARLPRAQWWAAATALGWLVAGSIGVALDRASPPLAMGTIALWQWVWLRRATGRAAWWWWLPAFWSHAMVPPLVSNLAIATRLPIPGHLLGSLLANLVAGVLLVVVLRNAEPASARAA